MLDGTDRSSGVSLSLSLSRSLARSLALSLCLSVGQPVCLGLSRPEARASVPLRVAVSYRPPSEASWEASSQGSTSERPTLVEAQKVCVALCLCHSPSVSAGVFVCFSASPSPRCASVSLRRRSPSTGSTLSPPGSSPHPHCAHGRERQKDTETEREAPAALPQVCLCLSLACGSVAAVPVSPSSLCQRRVSTHSLRWGRASAASIARRYGHVSRWTARRR